MGMYQTVCTRFVTNFTIIIKQQLLCLFFLMQAKIFIVGQNWLVTDTWVSGSYVDMETSNEANGYLLSQCKNKKRTHGKKT